MSVPQHLITLQRIRNYRPCSDGWEALLQGLGTRNLALKVTIADVAVINTTERGVVLAVQDALWCLRCVNDGRLRVRTILPAIKRAAAHTQDQRMHDCIANIERWLAGDSSIDLKATRKVAKAATRSGAAATRAVAAAVARAASTVASSATETTIAAGDVAWAVSLAAPWELRNKAVLAEYQAQRDDLVALFGLYAAKEKRKA